MFAFMVDEGVIMSVSLLLNKCKLDQHQDIIV